MPVIFHTLQANPILRGRSCLSAVAVMNHVCEGRKMHVFLYLCGLLAAFPYQMFGSQHTVSSSGHHTLAVLVQWDRSAKSINLLMSLVTGCSAAYDPARRLRQDANMQQAGLMKSVIPTTLAAARQVFSGINSHCSPRSHLFSQKQFSCHYSKSYLGEQKGKIMPIFQAFHMQTPMVDAHLGTEAMHQYNAHLCVWIIDGCLGELAKFILQRLFRCSGIQLQKMIAFELKNHKKKTILNLILCDSVFLFGLVTIKQCGLKGAL